MSAFYCEPPNDKVSTARPAIFLAGGITDCPDWQAEMVAALFDLEVTLLNPRQKHFPINDPDAAKFQIGWEYRMLRLADVILFWFPCETLCPIALYELGAWSMTGKPIAVGCHPAYIRRADVEIQMRLVRPEVTVVDALDALAAETREALVGMREEAAWW